MTPFQDPHTALLIGICIGFGLTFGLLGLGRLFLAIYAVREQRRISRQVERHFESLRRSDRIGSLLRR